MKPSARVERDRQPFRGMQTTGQLVKTIGDYLDDLFPAPLQRAYEYTLMALNDLEEQAPELKGRITDRPSRLNVIVSLVNNAAELLAAEIMEKEAKDA